MFLLYQILLVSKNSHSAKNMWQEASVMDTFSMIAVQYLNKENNSSLSYLFTHSGTFTNNNQSYKEILLTIKVIMRHLDFLFPQRVKSGRHLA